MIGALVLRAPVHAFLAALLLSAFEGAIKVRLAIEGAPSPRTIGAVGIDLALFSSIAGLVIRDRGATLRLLWGNMSRFERIALGGLVGWVAVSLLQTAQGGDVVAGLEGFRLSQAYTAAALAGLLIYRSGLPSDSVTRLLLGVLAIASGYAALRTITGTTGSEVSFVDERTQQAALGTTGRGLGGFSSPFGLASFARARNGLRGRSRVPTSSATGSCPHHGRHRGGRRGRVLCAHRPRGRGGRCRVHGGACWLPERGQPRRHVSCPWRSCCFCSPGRLRRLAADE